MDLLVSSERVDAMMMMMCVCVCFRSALCTNNNQYRNHRTDGATIILIFSDYSIMEERDGH